MQANSDRQKRELDYHRRHATAVAGQYKAMDFSVIAEPRRRWWNAYWDVWTLIRALPLRGRKVLVVGCGSGTDALLFSKLGADVSAFDLSPDMLALGVGLAARAGLPVAFERMAAENMTYPDATFDIVFARDILHHVDIPATMKEIVRVSKPGALFIVDEIYSHSLTELVRKSRLVEKILYPRMQKFVYKDRPVYITEDERKLTEGDVAEVRRHMGNVHNRKYFNFLVTRLVSDDYTILNKLDRLLLMLLGPLGYFCAGRIVFSGSLRHPS